MYWDVRGIRVRRVTTRMHISVLHNSDHEVLKDDPGREAREDVVRVAAALCDALTEGAVTAEPVPVGHEPLAFVTVLEERRPDLVVNVCESVAADSRGEMLVPAVLDVLGLPYTGSSALSLGLALHKNKAKELLHSRGVSTPAFALISTPEDLLRLELPPFPLIVKPCREDASVGVDLDSVVHSSQELRRAVLAVLKRFRQPALVEQFIAGREIYVPILGNRPRKPLPLSEIHFGKAFQGRPNIVSYRAKWDEASAECIDSPSGPCALDRITQARVVKTALAAFEALDCRDYGRVDLRLTAEGEPFIIDINPNCDLHPHAGFAKAALAAGMSYRDLALELVEVALERSHGNTSHRTPGSATAVRSAVAHRNVLAGRGRVRSRAHRSRAHAE
jgi:D-alanine-D-alanine ligase